MNTTKIKDKLKNETEFQKTAIGKKLWYPVFITFELMLEATMFFVGFIIAILIIPLNLDKILAANSSFVSSSTALLFIWVIIFTALATISIIAIIVYFKEYKRWLRGLK